MELDHPKRASAHSLYIWKHHYMKDGILDKKTLIAQFAYGQVLLRMGEAKKGLDTLEDAVRGYEHKYGKMD